MQTSSSSTSPTHSLLKPLERRSESFVQSFLWGLFIVVIVVLGLRIWAGWYTGPVARNGMLEALLVPAEVREISNLFVPAAEGMVTYDSDPIDGGYKIRLPKGTFSDREIVEKGRREGFEIVGFDSSAGITSMVSENDKWRVAFVTEADERTVLVWKKLYR